MQEFYTPFKANLLIKEKEIQKKDLVPEETTTEICELCGAPMKVRLGRFGKFLGCSTFPKCKGLKKLASEQKTIGMVCPKCGSPSPPDQGRGPLPSRERQKLETKSSPLGGEEKGEGLPSLGGQVVEKRTKKGRTFWGCNKWPTCDYASWKNPTLPVQGAEKESSPITPLDNNNA